LFSALITEADVDKKSSQKGEWHIYAGALANIIFAMKGIRILERFGVNLPKANKKSQSRLSIEYLEWTFDPRFADGRM